jgi:hypothetical protein
MNLRYLRSGCLTGNSAETASKSPNLTIATALPVFE